MSYKLTMQQQSSDVASLTDIELLAAFIHSGRNTAAAVDLADRLLRRFGTLRQVLQADVADIRAEKGIGHARATIIQALPELARRYFASSLPPGQTIRSPADTEAFLVAKMRHLGHELFCCLFLDNRHRILRFDEMFRGTIDGTSVYPREVVKEALAVNAAAVILAHYVPRHIMRVMFPVWLCGAFCSRTVDTMAAA